MEWTGGFDTEILSLDGKVTVKVTGQVDVVSSDWLLERATEVTAQGDGIPIEFDLGGITFIDTAGVVALRQARTRLEEAGRRVVFSELPASIRRLTDILGVDLDGDRSSP